MRIAVFSLLLLLIFSSCEKNSCLAPEEDTLYTKEFPINEIRNLQFDHVFRVKLFDDSLNKIILKADKNNIDNVSFEKKNNWLTINNSGMCDIFRGQKNIPSLEIHADDLDTVWTDNHIILESPDTIRYERFYFIAYGDAADCNLKVDNYHLSLTAGTLGGSYKVTGRCRWAAYSVTGTSFLDASEMKCNIPIIVNASVNDLYAYSDEWVWARINNCGNVILPFEPDSVSVEYNHQGRLLFSDKQKNSSFDFKKN